ncbi:unnamed protein product [Calypogeia fissa]
MTVTLCF